MVPEIFILITILVGLVLGTVPPPAPDVSGILGQVVGDIISSHIYQERCITVISEENIQPFTFLQSQVPVYFVRMSMCVVERDANNKEHVARKWEVKNSTADLILQTLDDGCLTYIIQVTHPTHLIRYLGQIIRSCIMRTNRKYLLLPVTEDVDKDLQPTFTAQNIFQMKEMNFMPDLVLVSIEKFQKIHFNKHMAEYQEVNFATDREMERENKVNLGSETTDSLKRKSDVICEKRAQDNTTNSCKERHENIMQPKIQNNLKFVTNYRGGFEVFLCQTYDEIFTKDKMSSLNTRETTDMVKEYMGFKVLTHNFVGEKPNGEVVLDVWIPEQGFLCSTDLFPDKVSNLKGKDLVAVGFEFPPYVVVSQSDRDQVYSGTEVVLLKEFSRLYNATFTFVETNVLYGDVWQNGSGFGILGMVAVDKVDFGISGIFIDWIAFNILDQSAPYYRSAVTCLVPRPRRLENWKILVKPFSPKVWLVTGAFVLGLAMALYSVSWASNKGDRRKRCSSFTSNLLVAVGMLVMTSSPKTDPGPIRHIHLWSSVTALLLTSIYSGIFASIHTVPMYEDPISTINDLATRGVLWAANDKAWVDLIAKDSDPVIQEVVQNFRPMSEEEMSLEGQTGETAFTIDRLQGGHYGLGSHLSLDTISKLRLLTEDLYHGYGTVVVRKGSPYLEKLNSMILRMVESGLYLLIESRVVREFMRQDEQKSIRYSTDEDFPEPIVLAFEHVEGPILLLAIGLALATVVAILEQLWKRIGTCCRKPVRLSFEGI